MQLVVYYVVGRAGVIDEWLRLRVSDSQGGYMEMAQLNSGAEVNNLIEFPSVE